MPDPILPLNEPANDVKPIKPADEPKPFVKPDAGQDTRPVAAVDAEGTPAAVRLKAAHDKLLGPDVPTINGEPEKGVGSKHSRLHPAHLAHLHALEHLVTVETEYATAEQHLAAAKAKLDHALKRADDTEVASDEVKAEEEKPADEKKKV